MDEIRFIRGKYVDLRGPLALWLPGHLGGKAWYYRPTTVSISAAWIVPHLVATEHIAVYTRIKDWRFPPVLRPEQVERYKGGAPGHTMPESELMSLPEALALLARAREASLGLLDAIISDSPTASGLDRSLVFERYFHVFSHDTEHLGQIRYLAGTWARLQGGAG